MNGNCEFFMTSFLVVVKKETFLIRSSPKSEWSRNMPNTKNGKNKSRGRTKESCIKSKEQNLTKPNAFDLFFFFLGKTEIRNGSQNIFLIKVRWGGKSSVRWSSHVLTGDRQKFDWAKTPNRLVSSRTAQLFVGNPLLNPFSLKTFYTEIEYKMML